MSAKLEARPLVSKGRFGVFARESVAAGELLVVWGGNVVTSEQFAHLPERYRIHSIQIEDDLYQVPSVAEEEVGDYINHSCNPNAGLRGPISLIALRNIQPNEEVCFDYVMSDGSPYCEFECACGAPNCRGQVTGEDWMRPDLQEKYAGYFSPYLQARIDRLKAAKKVLTNGVGNTVANGNGYHAHVVTTLR